MKQWIIPIALLLGLKILTLILKQVKDNPKSTNDKPSDYKGKYKKKLLLSKNEVEKYNKMIQVIKKLNLNLLMKVRLADIIEPAKGQKKWKTYWYKIQSKHVDFLLCDKDITPICVIEIDDSSHDKADRVKRDEFVDYILNDCGINVLRYRTINPILFETDIKNLLYKPRESTHNQL